MSDFEETKIVVENTNPNNLKVIDIVKDLKREIISLMRLDAVEIYRKGYVDIKVNDKDNISAEEEKIIEGKYFDNFLNKNRDMLGKNILAHKDYMFIFKQDGQGKHEIFDVKEVIDNSCEVISKNGIVLREIW